MEMKSTEEMLDPTEFIVNNHTLFGGRVTHVSTENEHCNVVTAKEGRFKGLSTIIVSNGMPIVTILYEDKLSKKERQTKHNYICIYLKKQFDKNKLTTSIANLKQHILVDLDICKEFIELYFT